MNANLTEIAYILDRSGSMQPHTESAIAGFNQFLRDQQQMELAGDSQTRLTLMLFDDEHLFAADRLPITSAVNKVRRSRRSGEICGAVGRGGRLWRNSLRN